MLDAEVVVVDVVRGSDFEGAGAEFAFHILVVDEGDGAVDKGHDGAFALVLGVALVVRVHTDGRVAEDGLRARGGDGDEFARLALDGVTHIIELGMQFLVDHLLVGDGGEGLGVPVDHAHAAIDLAFAVEVDENVDDRFGEVGVHGEFGAVPVAGGAEFAELLEDDAAVFLFPLPGIFEELLAGQGFLVDALFLEEVDHLGFGGDGGVVGAGHPDGVEAEFAGAAYQHVLDGVVEHVAHVKHARHIWRRNHDGVCRTPIRLGVKHAMVGPIFVPFVFYNSGIVLGC